MGIGHMHYIAHTLGNVANRWQQPPGSSQELLSKGKLGGRSGSVHSKVACIIRLTFHAKRIIIIV